MLEQEQNISEQVIAGGWSNWDFAPSTEAKHVFAEAVSKLKGVHYTLVASRQQIVNGINYHFICSGTVVVPNAPTKMFEISAYAPFDGSPVVTKIEHIGPEVNGLPGGWQSWNIPSSEDATNALHNALVGIVGATYKPYASTLQVVAGLNFCLLCEQTIVIPDSPKYASLVYAYQDLKGNAHISQIIKIE
jgi:hypothetical protein|nr:hypothetical protein [uncultured Flavobacterium sp.]